MPPISKKVPAVAVVVAPPTPPSTPPSGVVVGSKVPRKTRKFMKRYAQANHGTFPLITGLRKGQICRQTRSHRVIREINAALNAPDCDLTTMYPIGLPVHLQIDLEACKGARKISRAATEAFNRGITAHALDGIRRSAYLTTWVRGNRTTDVNDVRSAYLLRSLK
jgi:hypothetical protein